MLLLLLVLLLFNFLWIIYSLSIPLWNVTQCHWVIGSRRFEGTYWLYLQGPRVTRTESSTTTHYLNADSIHVNLSGVISHFASSRSFVVFLCTKSCYKERVGIIYGLLSDYTASCGNYLPTFRDNVLVPSGLRVITQKTIDYINISAEARNQRLGMFMIQFCTGFNVIT